MSPIPFLNCIAYIFSLPIAFRRRERRYRGIERNKKVKEKKRTLGLYVHIPFCVRKCNYCDFLSFSATEEVKEQYVQALCDEIISFSHVKNVDFEVATIFFGGGTPSVLKGEQMERIMKAIRQAFPVKADAEITIEMNPGTVTKEKLETYYKIGINRLSIGLQTTDDERLKVLGRIHTYEQFLHNYQWAREVGFQNISVDLMSALPKEDLASYQKDIERILALQPEHISSYSLIIEEGTPFYNNNEILDHLPEEEEDRAMYELTRQLLQKEGYHRYEISNYAKEGKESRHNSVYWTGGEYLGLGLGASSYLRSDHRYVGDKEKEEVYAYRFKNVSSMKAYLENPVTVCKEREEWTEITKKDAMEEFMYLGLRMRKGISEKEFFEKFKEPLEDIYGEVLLKFHSMNLLAWNGEKGERQIYLTDQGIDVSNAILCEFLLS